MQPCTGQQACTGAAGARRPAGRTDRVDATSSRSSAGWRSSGDRLRHRAQRHRAGRRGAGVPRDQRPARLAVPGRVAVAAVRRPRRRSGRRRRRPRPAPLAPGRRRRARHRAQARHRAGRQGDRQPAAARARRSAPTSSSAATCSLSGESFVSGHAVLVAALAGVVTPYLPGPLADRAVGCSCCAVMVGRVYVGAHNPLDVVCGAALGVAIAGVPQPRAPAPDDSATTAPRRPDARWWPPIGRSTAVRPSRRDRRPDSAVGDDDARRPLADDAITVGSFDFAESVDPGRGLQPGPRGGRLRRRAGVRARARASSSAPALDRRARRVRARVRRHRGRVPQRRGRRADRRRRGDPRASSSTPIGRSRCRRARSRAGPGRQHVRRHRGDGRRLGLATLERSRRRWPGRSSSAVRPSAPDGCSASPGSTRCTGHVRRVRLARRRRAAHRQRAASRARSTSACCSRPIRRSTSSAWSSWSTTAGLQPAENITPLVRTSCRRPMGRPTSSTSIDAVSARLTTAAVRDLNGAAGDAGRRCRGRSRRTGGRR